MSNMASDFHSNIFSFNCYFHFIIIFHKIEYIGHLSSEIKNLKNHYQAIAEKSKTEEVLFFN